MSKLIDMSGKKFAALTVIKRSPRKNAKGQAYWICKCDCGRYLQVRGDNLRRGIARQCTCCFGHGGTVSDFIYDEGAI